MSTLALGPIKPSI